MLKTDEDALICDFAETYHIYDYRELPLLTVATLAAGLRDDSRIKMKISGLQYSPQMIMNAMAVDRLSLLVYANTTDARKGNNPPKMICEELFKKDSEKVKAYHSGTDFSKAYKELCER